MKGFLLDTNIPSETTRPNPQSSVSRWLDDAEDDQLYFSVVSLGEILKGVTVLSGEQAPQPTATVAGRNICGPGFKAASYR
ncbi:MAG: hypothetical protein LAP87_09690 [Acidobacteriia bacterium]|nr:hypothetical protein [Terriglobia bacterium]